MLTQPMSQKEVTPLEYFSNKAKKHNSRLPFVVAIIVTLAFVLNMGLLHRYIDSRRVKSAALGGIYASMGIGLFLCIGFIFLKSLFEKSSPNPYPRIKKYNEEEGVYTWIPDKELSDDYKKNIMVFTVTRKYNPEEYFQVSSQRAQCLSFIPEDHFAIFSPSQSDTKYLIIGTKNGKTVSSSVNTMESFEKILEKMGFSKNAIQLIPHESIKGKRVNW